MNSKENIRKILREGTVDFDKIGSEHKTGFCHYNPKIAKYALQNPEQLAETLAFVIATQQADWPKVVALFKYMIFKLYKDGHLWTSEKEKSYHESEPYYSLIGYMGKKKIEPINYIWANRNEIYSKTKNILAGNWEYGDINPNSETSIFNLYEYYSTLPQLALAKAGFAVQMVTGRIGCFDSVNSQIYKMPNKYKEQLLKKDEKTGKYAFMAPNKNRLQGYIDFLKTLKSSEKDDTSQLLWDRWTHVIADRISGDWTKKGTKIKSGKKMDIVKPYKSLSVHKNPEVRDYMKKYGKGVTGDEITKQHYMPHLVHGEEDFEDTDSAKVRNVEKMVKDYELAKKEKERRLGGKQTTLDF